MAIWHPELIKEWNNNEPEEIKDQFWIINEPKEINFEPLVNQFWTINESALFHSEIELIIRKDY